MDDDLCHVRRLGDVGEERLRTSGVVTVVDESPDETRKAEGDMHGREAEHEHGDPEDDGRDVPPYTAEAGYVDVGPEEARIEACIRE